MFAVHEELAGAGVLVVGGAGQTYGRLTHAFAHLGGQMRRRRLLDELLVTPLQGTIALEQVDYVTVAVGEDLHLDVARLLDVLFEVDAAVLEGVLGLLTGLLEAGLKTDVVAGHAHAAAAAAGRRLDQHRVADAVRQSQGLGIAGNQALTAGHHRHAILLGQFASLVFVAQQFHGPFGGPINSILQPRQTSAKCGFSVRKP